MNPMRSLFVTTSKAPVTTSVALVTTNWVPGCSWHDCSFDSRRVGRL